MMYILYAPNGQQVVVYVLCPRVLWHVHYLNISPAKRIVATIIKKLFDETLVCSALHYTKP